MVKKALLIALLGGLVACVDSFTPRDLQSVEGYLVVEGNIALDGPFEIQLSRSYPITVANQTGKRSVAYVNDAVLHVKDAQGRLYPMIDTVVANGRYTFDLSSLHLDVTTPYQLVISTPDDGLQYESEPLVNRTTSDMELSYVIDSLAQEVRIMVSSYNPDRKASFYTWQFSETWDYVSQIAATCYFNGYAVVPSLYPVNHRCWKSQRSSDVLVLETEKLSENRVDSYVIQTIPYTDIRITQHYSILVTQSALDKDAYTFYMNMRKNSNDIGSLFSPQPNEISGNIHCTSDPSVPVVGYVSVCSSVTKRLFVDCRYLPKTYYQMGTDIEYKIDTPTYVLVQATRSGYLPYEYDDVKGVSIWNVRRCVDCTYRGGVLEPPAFWPKEWPIY